MIHLNKLVKLITGWRNTMKAMGDLNHNYETPSSIYLPIVPDNSDIVLNMVH